MLEFPYSIAGFAVGAIVGLTGVGGGSLMTPLLVLVFGVPPPAVGAGSVGVPALILLFPLLATVRVVGTDIAHAVPITLVAGLGHAFLGNVNWWLLASLLVGSLPGILVGSHLAARIPERFLRTSLAAVLLLAGTKLVMH